MTRTRIFVVFLFWAAGATVALSQPALEMSHGLHEPVMAGQTIEIRVVSPEPGLAIEVETRPGSRLAHSRRLAGSEAREDASMVDPVGHEAVSWTASQAGLVRFRLTDEAGVELDRTDLAVRYRRRPLSAVLVLTAAGGLLFAGICIGFRRTG